MKTRMLFSLALAAVLLTSTAFANVSENVFNLAGTTVKISTTDKALVVNLSSATIEDVTIKIEDAFGGTLLTEKVKGMTSFAKKYNVSKLETGKYTLTVTKKTVRTVQPFQVSANGVYISDMEKKEKFLPAVNLNDNKLDVNVLLGNYSNITVTITDNEGRVVKQDKNYVVLDLHTRYDIAQLPAGVYVVEVQAGDETFYHTIKKVF
jgi:hypothetical protein